MKLAFFVFATLAVSAVGTNLRAWSHGQAVLHKNHHAARVGCTEHGKDKDACCKAGCVFMKTNEMDRQNKEAKCWNKGTTGTDMCKEQAATEAAGKTTPSTEAAGENSGGPERFYLDAAGTLGYASGLILNAKSDYRRELAQVNTYEGELAGSESSLKEAQAAAKKAEEALAAASGKAAKLKAEEEAMEAKKETQFKALTAAKKVLGAEQGKQFALNLASLSTDKQLNEKKDEVAEQARLTEKMEGIWSKNLANQYQLIKATEETIVRAEKQTKVCEELVEAYLEDDEKLNKAFDAMEAAQKGKGNDKTKEAYKAQMKAQKEAIKKRQEEFQAKIDEQKQLLKDANENVQKYQANSRAASKTMQRRIKEKQEAAAAAAEKIQQMEQRQAELMKHVQLVESKINEALEKADTGELAQNHFEASIEKMKTMKLRFTRLHSMAKEIPEKMNALVGTAGKACDAPIIAASAAALDEVATLVGEFKEEHKKVCADVAALKTKLEELKVKIDATAKQIKAVNGQKSAAEKEKDITDEKIKRLNGNIQELSQAIATAVEEITKTKAKTDTAQKENEELSTKLNKMNEDLNKLKEDLENEKTRFRQLESEATAKIEKAKTELKVIEAKAREAEAALQTTLQKEEFQYMGLGTTSSEVCTEANVQKFKDGQCAPKKEAECVDECMWVAGKCKYAEYISKPLFENAPHGQLLIDMLMDRFDQEMPQEPAAAQLEVEEQHIDTTNTNIVQQALESEGLKKMEDDKDVVPPAGIGDDKLDGMMTFPPEDAVLFKGSHYGCTDQKLNQDLYAAGLFGFDHDVTKACFNGKKLDQCYYNTPANAKASAKKIKNIFDKFKELTGGATTSKKLQCKVTAMKGNLLQEGTLADELEKKALICRAGVFRGTLVETGVSEDAICVAAHPTIMKTPAIGITCGYDLCAE